MDDKDHQQRGVKARRKVLGDAWVDRSDSSRNSFNTEWFDGINGGVWAKVWTRPQLDERTRRVLVMGTLLALGHWDEFRLHVRAALTEGGFSTDDIKEIVWQQSHYCGVPAANRAMREAGDVLKELGKL